MHKVTLGITLGALVLALLAFGVGRLAGRLRKQEHAIFVLGGIALILAVLFGVAIRSSAKTVSGSFLVWETVLLLTMIVMGMLGGFMSVVAARKSNGPRRVKAKIGATIIGELILAGLMYALTSPVVGQVSELGLLESTPHYEPEKNKACPDNLKSLYNAFTLYAQDWDALPPGANWLGNEDLISKVRQNEWLHCPAVSNRNDAKYGYAYNDAIAGHKLNGKKIADLPDAAKTPLLYDSTNLDKSAHDNQTSLPKPGRHGGRNNILYCDGHVEAVAPK